jgi:hypothetical protein
MKIYKAKWLGRQFQILIVSLVLVTLLHNNTSREVVQIMTSQNKNLTEFILPSNTPNTLVEHSVNTTNQLPQAMRWNISASNTESKHTIWNESLIASMSRSYSIWNVSTVSWSRNRNQFRSIVCESQQMCILYWNGSHTSNCRYIGSKTTTSFQFISDGYNEK